MSKRNFPILVIIPLILLVSSIAVHSVSVTQTTIPSYGAITYSSTESRYGVCFHAFNEYNAGTKAIFEDLASAGSIWGRSDWRNPPYGAIDMVAWKNEIQMGHKPLPILNYYTMRWNSSFTLNDWKREVTTAVNSAPDVPAWEIWNEPNLAQFQLGYMDGTPQHYFDMLKEAYTIIKSINPNALVVGPR